jgi:ubiquinone/menaquinone biosynthesis C-methylase UbiE
MSAGRDPMVKVNTGHITYGRLYHTLYDRFQAEARAVVAGIVPAGSSVLDMACGTGELCFELAASKRCRVMGLDMSCKMIEFARKRNRCRQVHFVHGDGANLAFLEDDTFDYAAIMFLLHEVHRSKRTAVLSEALRVAPKAIVVDAWVPLPHNLPGLAWRTVELSFGLRHYRVFSDYLSAGGLDGILADPHIHGLVALRRVFWHGCREVVVLERQTQVAV